MISLIICTFKRPEALKKLLESILNCSTKPDEILIIDSSPDNQTQNMIVEFEEKGLGIRYFLVEKEYRGLTRQRNFGVGRVDVKSDIIAFLDDDLTVDSEYFKHLVETYTLYPDAIGIGGIDVNDNGYFRKPDGFRESRFDFYELDNWIIKEPGRYKLRKILGLMSDLPPGLIPEFSHGRSVLPPTGRIYMVEHFTGMSMSFKKDIFDRIKFSSFFEGYGLYEDFDFCVRALKYGNLYVNTNAKVWHYHEPSGRPDFYKYGKMVVKNGWYVWRVRHPSPSLKAKLKWHAISLLLANIRLVNAISGPDRKNALLDYFGRMIAWFGLWLEPPVIQNHPLS